MSDLNDKILEMISDICGTKKIKKNPDMNLVEAGYLDSMGLVELLTELEDEFDIEIELDSFDMSKFDTANKIIQFVLGEMN